MRGWLVGIVILVGAANADPAPNKLEVEVGKTVERDVGVLRGYFCDDPSLITADLVTHNDVNVWVVTGVKVGSTQCRVGDHTRPALVFDVVVKAAR
jgi:hypothetical protein